MNTRNAILHGGRVALLVAAIGALLPGCLWRRQDLPVSAAAYRLPSLEQSFAGVPAAPKTPPAPALAPPAPPPLPPPTDKVAPSIYPVAMAVPGKEGVVLSPYNNRLVDVSGWKSGTLMADPRYPTSEKKYFRVP